MELVQWKLKDGTPVTNLPNDVYGFIYVIKYRNGMYYIGKKQVEQVVKLKPLLTGEPRKGHLNYFYKGKGNKFEKVKKQSNWKSYTGSSELTPDVETISHRTIIHVTRSKQTLTYLETKALFEYNAIPSTRFYNASIRPIAVYDNAMNGAYDIGDLKQKLEGD